MAKVGRPPKYKTPQELEQKIQEYFDSCWIDKVTEIEEKEKGLITTSNIKYQNRPYTVAGLAEFLGFSSRQSLLDYDANPEFLDIIKRAKLKIEMFIEEQLVTGKNAAGTIFWLKNHADYRDKQEMDLNHSGGIKHLLEEIDGKSLGPPNLRDK